MKLLRFRFLTLAGLCTLAASVSAGPTSLAFIPIADILRHREVSTDWSAFGNERRVDPKVTRYSSMNVGFFDRMEFGLDTDPAGSEWYSVKILLFEKGGEEEVSPSPSLNASLQGAPVQSIAQKRGPKDYAFSAGFQNADNRGYWEPYLVGRVGFGSWRLHFGAMRTDIWRPIGGADLQIGDWSLSMDCLGGPGAIVWTGAAYSPPVLPGLILAAYAGYPLRRSDGIQYELYVGRIWRM